MNNNTFKDIEKELTNITEFNDRQNIIFKQESSFYPLISIIIPSYNQGRYLERTLLSLLKQTYKNIEIILIDGGSKDETLEIIKKYEKFLSYWVSEKDNGQANAINKGLKIAKGTYVTWLCSDDILFKDALSIMANALESHPEYSLVYGGGVFIDEQDKIIKKFSFTDMNLEKLLYQKHSTIAQPSSLIRMDFLKKVGFLEESLNYCMDYDLWIRLIKEGPFLNLGEVILSGYRLHTNSKTVGSYTKMALEKIKVNRRYTNDLINKLIYKHYWYIIQNLINKIFRKKK